MPVASVALERWCQARMAADLTHLLAKAYYVFGLEHIGVAPVLAPVPGTNGYQARSGPRHWLLGYWCQARMASSGLLAPGTNVQKMLGY